MTAVCFHSFVASPCDAVEISKSELRGKATSALTPPAPHLLPPTVRRNGIDVERLMHVLRLHRPVADGSNLFDWLKVERASKKEISIVERVVAKWRPFGNSDDL